MSPPESSSPTQPIIRTSAPSRRAATAWLAPLPPRFTRSVPAETVSPTRGRRGSATVKSTLAEPITQRRGTGAPGPCCSTRSASTSTATRQVGARLRCDGISRRSASERPRVSRPSHSTSTWRGSRVTSEGSSATAIASGSCSTIPPPSRSAPKAKPCRVKSRMKRATRSEQRQQPLRERRLREHHPARHVERHQLHREPGLEHRRGRLRIHVEVELGGRRDVAGHRDRAAHDHDAAGPAEPPGVLLEGERQVGQRPQGHDGQLGSPAICRVQNHFRSRPHLNGVGRLRVAGLPVGLDEALEVAEPVLAMHLVRGDQRPLERGRGAAGERRRRIGRGDREDAAGVRGRAIHRDVAGDGGDGLDARVGRAQGEQDRQRVVDAGVGVDQEVLGHLTVPAGVRIIRGRPAQTRRKGGSDAHPDHVLRRVKLSSPGLQFAGRDQEQVRHRLRAARRRRRHLHRRGRRQDDLRQPGHVPLPRGQEVFTEIDKLKA